MNNFPGSDDAQWARLLDRLHQTPLMIAIVSAGGGAGAVARCFRRPGASQTFLEAVIPYARAAMREYLGADPVAGHASAKTCVQLARRARQRAEELVAAEAFHAAAVGIAVVGALPSSVDDPNPAHAAVSPTGKSVESSYRIHAASCSDGGLRQYRVDFGDLTVTRSAAEQVSDEILVCVLGDLVGLPINERGFVDAGLRLETSAAAS